MNYLNLPLSICDRETQEVNTDETLQGKGTTEEPLKVTNPEKDIFLEVDNIEIDPDPSAIYTQDRNGRHGEIDLCHFQQIENGSSISPTIYEQTVDGGWWKRYYFIPKSPTLRLSYALRHITNKHVDKLIIGVELGKQFEQHPTMEHIVANFEKSHHYHTFCDSLFLVQRDYKTTTRLHNVLTTYKANELNEKRYYKNTESDSLIREISFSDQDKGFLGYVMGTPYSANNFLGGVIGYDAFSAVSYIQQEYAIFDSILGIQQYIVQAMYIAGTGSSQTLEIELKLITDGRSDPSEIKKFVSGGIHIYLP